MRIGSLFAGVGGLELGLETAGVGETVWQVEIDPFCRAVLAKHWPNAKRFDDVRTVGAAILPPVDLICGGFPCQDVSSAGSRKGLAGERSGLWREYARILAELRPDWVAIENVASGANAWVDAVVRDLAELGYASLPLPIAASDLGAPHRRARVFVVAHADGVASSGAGSERTRRTESSGGRWSEPMPDLVRVVHGVSRELDAPSKRIAALGNSVVPQQAEVVGHVILELRRRLMLEAA